MESDESFSRRVDALPWPESWDRWFEGSSPEKASPAQVQAAVDALQRSLSAVSGREVSWRDDRDEREREVPFLDPLDGLGVELSRRLAARLALDTVSTPQALLDDAARVDGHDAVLQQVLGLRAHRFQQLVHFTPLYVPAALGTVLVGLPCSIGSSTDLQREIEDLRSVLEITRGGGWFESSRISGSAAKRLLGSLTVLSDAASASAKLGLPLHLAW